MKTLVAILLWLADSVHESDRLSDSIHESDRMFDSIMLSGSNFLFWVFCFNYSSQLTLFNLVSQDSVFICELVLVVDIFLGVYSSLSKLSNLLMYIFHCILLTLFLFLYVL